MSTRRVVMITTGGTAASRSTEDGTVPVLHAADLVPQTAADIAVTPVELMAKDSSALTVRDQFAIVAAIAEAFADSTVVGVVVTHGTDTLEETAFLADVFAADPRPVVFTGAQYAADHALSDGPANIGAAVALAADPDSRGRGVLVALGGRVLGARGAFKISTTDVVAFDTVHADMPRPLVARSLPAGHPARVDLLALYPGVSPGTIASGVAQRAAGIVLSATGSGNTHPDITAEVHQAVQKNVAVVVSTRVPFGEVEPTYGGGGGGVDLVRAGAIFSPWLRAPQARMALIALLSTGADATTVAEFFRASSPAS
ncbi:asparaginase domain-containing protein [Gordonia sp. (in: high G+C Gram-positive bacteria)]|uniref:asparaginase domain-containing protein n=1 Tax=Gordonia sp. (in: high G+C Gram-positive bacteria) TaxID=84139 RepID=UPI0016AE5E56|nr:asparaginase domain-containing protein [Gordonia sp. (in: high G+C Gram-positive bacteria)]NLG46612.1 asparaginase [Gordonia sp. (in: high G+C Gram-positive bacteria)]